MSTDSHAAHSARESLGNRRGRKPRLTPEMIFLAAFALLADDDGGLTMAKLAKELGVGVMSLYRYFPSRDALLDAMAKYQIQRFEPPEGRNKPWQDIVVEWLRATQRLWDDYPAFLKIVCWDHRYSESWVKAWWLPLARVLAEHCADDDRLAFAMGWLNSAAVGLIISETDHSRRQIGQSFVPFSTLPAADNLFAENVITRMAGIDRTAIREFSYRNIIVGLEAILHRQEDGRYHLSQRHRQNLLEPAAN